MTATDSAGSHKHVLPAAVSAAIDSIGGLDARIAALDQREADHFATFTDHMGAAEARLFAVEARLTALEQAGPPVIVPGPDPFAPDFHIAPDGNDSNDGLTHATAWRSLANAPGDAVTALWDGGVIAGGAIYDRAVHLVTAPGVHAQIKGPGQYSLRLQRAHGSSIKPGEGGAITAIVAAVPLEALVNGDKPGVSRRGCVQLTDCDELDLTLTVVAGTDFGILTAGTLRRCRVIADVSDAGHGFMLKGNIGTGTDRSWFGGHAHDCHRLVRSTAAPGDDYGAVGFVFENSVGGGLLGGWRATECWAPSPDYVADGGALEFYDATDAVVEESGPITRCEGGLETGGSAGKGCHRIAIATLHLAGDMGPGTAGGAARSPGVLLRNFEASSLDVDLDITRARVALEMYADSGSFGGSIANSTITGHIVRRPGVEPISQRDVPASTTVNVAVLTNTPVLP